MDGAMAEELARTKAAPVSEKEAETEPDEGAAYRFALQPMWQRPVRGLGVVEPWSLTRRKPKNPA